jgi:hypothetical protein
MSELYNTFFGPLGKEYCVLFFVMVVVSLVNVFLIGFGAIRHIFDVKSKDRFNAIVLGTGAILTVFVNYIFSRVLYTMCLKSL